MTSYFRNFAAPIPPQIPIPDATPIDNRMVGNPYSSVFLFNSSKFFRMANAQSSARLASLDAGNGTPTAIVAKGPLVSVTTANSLINSRYACKVTLKLVGCVGEHFVISVEEQVDLVWW